MYPAMSLAMIDQPNGHAPAGTAQGTFTDLPVRLSKSTSIKREPKFSGNNLRELYQDASTSRSETSPRSEFEHAIAGPSTPVLPPTPPTGADDVQDPSVDEPSSASEMTKLRSVLVTPVNQYSPPTPDHTPPTERIRHFLGAQPSMSSTRAESFKTAQEDLYSDGESEVSFPHFRSKMMQNAAPVLPLPQITQVHKSSPLIRAITPTITDRSSGPSLPVSPSLEKNQQGHIKGRENLLRHEDEVPFEESPTLPQHMFDSPQTPAHKVQAMSPGTAITSNNVEYIPQGSSVRRGSSLRERLEESRTAPRSPSLDKFATIIGWNDGVHETNGGEELEATEDSERTEITMDGDKSKRWSTTSASSVMDAYIISTPQFTRTRGTLRHVSKKDSLRSASSPLPTSDRTSVLTNSDSPHRLVHKKVRLSNVNRRSFGSEASRSMSVSSTLPSTKIEVIKVAVIPERVSSLQGSTSSSRRHSHSLSNSSGNVHLHGVSNNLDLPANRKRTVSESTGKSRHRYYPPQAPQQINVKNLSLSTPTSQTTSRANSVTSEYLRTERKQAERDLRTTLERMESERLVSSSNSFSVDSVPKSVIHLDNSAEHRRFSLYHEVTLSNPRISEQLVSPPSDVRARDFAHDAFLSPGQVVSGTQEWANLRPSVMGTPLSMPSFMSASPEIVEARAVNLFSHNSHSVQLIEPYLLQDSNAVQAIQFHNDEDISALPQRIESPLRNPRNPPPPPQSRSLTSTSYRNESSSLGWETSDHNKRFTSFRSLRPTLSNRKHTDSFGKNILRSVSLKHPINKKADQDLDPNFSPMWRPRAFWDDIEPGRQANSNHLTQERSIVENSLGLPQQRKVVNGPMELMRRISARRHERKNTLAKQASYGSLHRLQAGRKLYTGKGLGLRLHFASLRGLQHNLTMSKHRRDAERGERRREELRKSIGPNVISTGDSRFPASLRTSEQFLTPDVRA